MSLETTPAQSRARSGQALSPDNSEEQGSPAITLNRRDWMRLACGSAASVALGPAQTAAGRLPNIVLILTDDQGWWDVGVHGNRDIETPVMDRLAGEGVDFTHFYVSPVCAPTRSSLMTGRHYLRTGIYNTRFGGDTMHSGEVTMAEVLRARGYRTGLFGKWHLGRYYKYLPAQRGFDEAMTFTQGHTERYFYPDALEYNGERVQARGYITTLLTDAAISFVKKNRNPFFLYLAFNVPHSPHTVDDPYIVKYLKKGLPLTEARIYGMITQCDANIGRLLAVLDEQKLRDDTIVIFMSDNGGVSKHFKGGLRGNKASAFEGGVRVPFFVRWPGHFPAGAKVDAMAAHIDLLPTFCELTGAKLPADRVIDGKSILPLMRNGSGESPHEYLYHIWDRMRPTLESNWSIHGRRYKLAGKQLFDLKSDPGETTDISARHPDIARDLHDRFAQWLAEVTKGKKFEPVPIEVGRDEENPVEIQASWARINGTHVTWNSPGEGQSGGAAPLGDEKKDGAVNYTFAGYDWDTIDGWKNPGESVAWSLDAVKAGEYEVTLSYGCLPENAGGKFRITASGSTLEGAVQATPDRNLFLRRRVGTIHLRQGPAILKFEVVSAPRGELMALNRIWLRRL
ncbi:MAG TPA: arylsulfatase [Bryobacteraceae bacterium]|nr:arylsulfatase [Bryobacteraceae bacterium]